MRVWYTRSLHRQPFFRSNIMSRDLRKIVVAAIMLGAMALGVACSSDNASDVANALATQQYARAW